MSTPLIVYFSSTSENTHRFVEKLGFDAVRIPVSMKTTPVVMLQEYILVCPTFAGDDGRGAVPKQVIRFLNDDNNRSRLRGVIAGGSRNFGQYFGYSGKVISKKCNVPLLYRFELMGTPEDVQKVQSGVVKFWKTLSSEDEVTV